MTKPKVYVCSRASNPRRPEMWRTFRELGANIISTWIDEAGEGQTSNMSELWTRIVDEIAQCDRVVAFIKAEDLPVKGVFIEIGIALAFNKPVYLFTPDILTLGELGNRPIGSWVAHPLVHPYSGDQCLTMHQYLMGFDI